MNATMFTMQAVLLPVEVTLNSVMQCKSRLAFYEAFVCATCERLSLQASYGFNIEVDPRDSIRIEEV